MILRYRVACARRSSTSMPASRWRRWSTSRGYADNRRSHQLPSAMTWAYSNEINGRIDDAEVMYRKAAALDLNELYLKAISALRRAKEDQKRLREQQRSAPPRWERP